MQLSTIETSSNKFQRLIWFPFFLLMARTIVERSRGRFATLKLLLDDIYFLRRLQVYAGDYECVLSIGMADLVHLSDF